MRRSVAATVAIAQRGAWRTSSLIAPRPRPPIYRVTSDDNWMVGVRRLPSARAPGEAKEVAACKAGRLDRKNLPTTDPLAGCRTAVAPDSVAKGPPALRRASVPRPAQRLSRPRKDVGAQVGQCLELAAIGQLDWRKAGEFGVQFTSLLANGPALPVFVLQILLRKVRRHSGEPTR